MNIVTTHTTVAGILIFDSERDMDDVSFHMLSILTRNGTLPSIFSNLIAFGCSIVDERCQL